MIISYRKVLARIAIFTIIPGITPAIFMLVSMPHPSLDDVLRPALEGIVYAGCISAMSWAVLHRLAEFLFRRSPLRRWALLVATIAVIALVGCVLASTLLYLCGVTQPRDLVPDFLISMKFSLLLTLLFGLGSFSYEVLLSRLNKAHSDAERLRQVATEARLSSLESRVQPHFLFNTLNSISALIREDPAQAERTVERLASLLRFSLDANESRLVPLSLELKVVRDYLEIEKTRFGARLRYRIDVPDSLNSLEVPPMSVQTLVENSVKHVVSARREGAEIEVRARVNAAGVPSIDVIDDGPGYDATAVLSGHGLDILQSRLALMFGPKPRCKLSPKAAACAQQWFWRDPRLPGRR